jgi:hypothetical protein
MAEILTESFCERCGTRYTFESPARRSNPLGALGTVGRGLRNFVASGDQSMDEAFAVARAENEQRATAHQLEAFHQTFNFCLSCRQYTCATCWNPVEGRCQSCAPMPEAEMLPAAEMHVDAPVVAEAMAVAWAAAAPVIELPPATEADAEPFDDAESFLDVEVPHFDSEPVAEAEPAPAEDDGWAEAVAVAEPEVAVAEPEPEVAVAEPAVAEPEVAEPEVAEPQPERAEPEGVVEPEVAPALVAALETEPLTEAEPMVAVEAETEPDPEPAAELEPPAEPRVRLRSSTLPAFPPGVSLDDEIAAYEQRIAAFTTPQPSPASARPTTQPDMPTRVEQEPERLRPAAAADRPVAMPATERAALPPIYVAGPVPDLPEPSPVALPDAQTTGSCASCGLTLSATARFCRRCGTAQHPV